MNIRYPIYEGVYRILTTERTIRTSGAETGTGEKPTEDRATGEERQRYQDVTVQPTEGFEKSHSSLGLFLHAMHASLKKPQ